MVAIEKNLGLSFKFTVVTIVVMVIQVEALC